MPTLKHLLEELGIHGVKPNDVLIPGEVYDDIVTEATEETGDDHRKEEG